MILKGDKLQEVLECMDAEEYAIQITGINFPSFLFHVLSLFEREKKLLLLVENYKISKRLYESLRAFELPVHEFLESEIHFFKSFSRSKDIEDQRLSAVYSLLNLEKSIIIATPNSILAPLMPLNFHSKKAISIGMGDSYDMDEICDILVSYGYERTDAVSSSSQFARRGSIIDIFDPLASHPFRIEFFADEVDSIRTFDVETQLSIENQKKVEFHPSNLSLLFDRRVSYVEKLREKARKCDVSEYADKYLELAQEIEQNGFLDEGFKYIPVLEEEYQCLFDYVDIPIVAWNYQNISSAIKESFEAWRIRFEDELLHFHALPEQIHLHGNCETLERYVNKSKLIMCNPLFYAGTDVTISRHVECHYTDVPLYHKNIKRIGSDLAHWFSQKYTIVIALSSENRLRGMKQLLEDLDFSGKYRQITHFEERKTGFINLISKGMNAGFVDEDEKLVFISEYELYDDILSNKNKKQTAKKMAKTFFDIEINDYVVHESYGIGKYLGVHQIVVDKDVKDYLKILYRNDDLLYVEVEKMDMVKKYIGDDSKTVKLSKLGSVEWKNTKKKVKKEVEEIAQELVELYAKRSRQEGYAFSQDNIWQQEFEASFEFSETDDQLRAIEEIKKDMQSKRPMDRLLCGDVGYGKTEVAIRAIFKAVQDSKQVAFLVPTTILAQQHYNTIKNRFKDFPIRVEMLSRFKGAKDQKLILSDIEHGIADVVVGTHRILSSDIHFKDFGLLVIDEEQRFGVKDKEKIKQLKNNIDVLTLSATPIPRTLHMSLMGIRDMSLIEEPPEDRYPVQTYVVDYNSAVIKDAIGRELARGGQVYFVHNRVKDIHEIVANLRHLIPDLKVDVAHGQMNSKDLEKVMLRFMNHEFDVLVSTVIVETGLDISNVNTIIINNSDHFGLSQLYQLKGRVGRSSRIGYAYLLYNPNKSMNEISQKRLRAIKEFSELGAGFKIAMRDLEIRGAGNVLGMSQHGHMISVGYELYSKMVEDVMNALTNEEGQTRQLEDYSDRVSEFKMDIRCSAYIPENYISDYRYKIECYKKISSIKSAKDRMNLESELIDMYGDIPEPVMNLIKIGYIKAMAIEVGISNIVDLNDKIKFKLFENHNISAPALVKLIQSYHNRLSIASKAKPTLLLRSNRRINSKAIILSDIIELMERLIQADNELKENK